MREEDKIFACIRGFVENGLSGNIEETMALIAPDIIGVGMGSQGTVNGKQEVLRILEAQNRPQNVKIELKYPSRRIRFYPPDFGVACIIYEVHVSSGEQTVKSAYIQTACAVKVEGEWKLCLLQAVPAELSTQSIESYPLKFADETLEHLKSELQEDMNAMLNESISSGIFSVYCRQPHGMYFINDSMLHMLGYGRAEFEQSFPPDRDCRELFSPESPTIEEWDESQGKNLDRNHTFQERICMKKKNGEYVWVETRTRRTQNERGENIFLTVAVEVTELVQLQQKTQQQNEMILSGIDYASRIQRHILPSRERLQQAFRDSAVIWEPRDIVGGDIYWLRSYQKGSLLCMCDCTGHGTPGALLTMLVSSAFDNIVTEENCDDTAHIMKELDRHLSQTLNVGQEKDNMLDIRDGCDLAIIFMGQEEIRISSSNTRVLICDGQEVRQIRGQRLAVGEGRIASAAMVHVTTLAAGSDSSFYVASDGLYDQIGSNNRPFGYRRVQDIIMEHYGESQEEVLRQIWRAFQEHCGTQERRDDVQIIGFRF